MPTNLPPQYQAAENEYADAIKDSEKITALQKMLSLVPKHKGTEKLVSEIKIKISKLKQKVEKEKKSKKRTQGLTIKREGCAQVILVGMENSGKSYLINRYTNAKTQSTKIPFETKEPVVGMAEYEKAKIQLIEVPSIRKDYLGKFLGVINNSDLIVLVLDPKRSVELQKSFIMSELKETKKKIVEIFNNDDKFLERIWNSLGLIRIFTKTTGKITEEKPITLKKESTVKDLAKEIHKDFFNKFKFAYVWGSSAKFPGQEVGLNHKLKDWDTVEIHLIK